MINLRRKSLLEIEENSYNNLCLLENSTSNPFAYIYFDDVDINKVFHHSYNKNAKYIYFTINDIKYLRLQIAVNLNTTSDIIDRKNKILLDQKYMNLRERGLMNRNSLEVYANGLKIPDSKILITIFQGSVDVYVPVSYLNNEESNNLTFVLNKYNNNKRYYNEFLNNSEINLNSIKTNEKNFSKKNIRIYKNGYLTTNYTIFSNFIRINDYRNNDNIEFCYVDDTIYAESLVMRNKYLIFPKKLLENKPISVDICEFYLNGARQFPRKMKNETPRNISLSNFSETNNNFIGFIRTNEKIYSKNHYIDDLTQYFNFKYDDALSILDKTYSGSDVPDYIQNINFPPEVIKVINEDRTKFGLNFDDFITKKIKDYIAQNPEFYKILLNNYSSNNSCHYFNYYDLSQFIRTSTEPDLGRYMYQSFEKQKLVFIFNKQYENEKYIFLSGNKKIEDKELFIITYKNKNYIYIDVELFDPNEKILAYVYPVYNTEYKYFIFSLGEDETLGIIEKESLGIVQNKRDLLVMEKTSVSSSIHHPVIENRFKKCKSNYFIDEDDNNYFIHNLEPNKTYIIYNCSFTMNDSYTITEDDIDYCNREKILPRININKEERNDPRYFTSFPRISYYNPFVFKNGIRLIEGLDYEIIGQYHNPERTKAEIFFKIPCEVGDLIEYQFIEGNNVERIASVDFINNHYGVIYFEKMEVPFDSGYLNLFINGKLVDPENIETISTNIIKVNNISPINDIYVESSLSVPLSDFKEFSDVFINNPSLWHEFIKNYYISKDKTDAFYEEYSDNSNPDVIISDNSEEEIIRMDLIANEVANQLKNGLLSHLIDCNIYYDFSDNGSLSELLVDGKDYISIDCNRYYIFELTELNSETTLRSYEEIEELIYNYYDASIDASYTFTNYENIWNYIYDFEIRQAGFDFE